jgi:hypothetical protein
VTEPLAFYVLIALCTSCGNHHLVGLPADGLRELYEAGVKPEEFSGALVQATRSGRLLCPVCAQARAN